MPIAIGWLTSKLLQALILAVKVTIPLPTFVTVTELPLGDKLTIPEGLAIQLTVALQGIAPTREYTEVPVQKLVFPWMLKEGAVTETVLVLVLYELPLAVTVAYTLLGVAPQTGVNDMEPIVPVEIV